MDLRALLQRRFGFDDYRPGQREIVARVAEGRDAPVVMPTGAVKSLGFEAPALARGGTTVVVSPLIAPIKDQTDATRPLASPRRRASLARRPGQTSTHLHIP